MGKAAFFLSLLLVFSPGINTVYSASFKDSVEAKEEEEKQKREEPQKKDQNNDQNNQNRNNRDRDRRRNNNRDSDNDSASLMAGLWTINNLYCHYGNYPYEYGGYVRHSYSDDSDNTPQKLYWFSTSLSGLYLGDMGFGGWASFSGNLYKFFGPYVDVFYTAREEMGGVRAGLHFSVIQSDPLNLSLYLQAQWYYGSLERVGGVGGFELRSYPYKPLSLRLKMGLQVFEYFQVGEVETEAGLMLQAWEILAGWRWWRLDNSTWNGPYLGVRRYF
jgi:hypothetical protein